jgi:starch phosphorylase
VDKLEAGDVQIELLLNASLRELAAQIPVESFLFRPEGAVESGEQRYVLEVPLESAGKLEYRIRANPSHPQLSHRFEMGLMRWL